MLLSLWVRASNNRPWPSSASVTHMCDGCRQLATSLVVGHSATSLFPVLVDFMVTLHKQQMQKLTSFNAETWRCISDACLQRCGEDSGGCAVSHWPAKGCLLAPARCA